MEEVTVTGFCNFCKNNIPLIIAVSIALFFTYGIRLLWYAIGIDAEIFMAGDISESIKWGLSIGRFGESLFLKLWHINGFNPFTSFFIAFCLIWFFTISWCYIIAVFCRDTGRNDKLVPFALVFMTMPVLAEQFYIIHTIAENALILSLCPYTIYLLFKGFLDNEKGKITCASVMLVFMISVYQAIVPMFCCGVFIYFVLLSEHSEYEPRVYQNLCLKLFISLLGSLVVYSFIDKIVIPAVFHIESSHYLDRYRTWGTRSVREIIVEIITFGYILTVGNIPLVQSVVHPFIARYSKAGIELVQYIANLSRVYGNILLLPSALFFLIELSFVMHRKIPSGRRLLYMLAAIGIPLCIIIMAVVNGGWMPIRTLYALPLASAFMLFYLIKTYKKKAALIVACLSLLIAVYQAQITAQLFYSDWVRYNEDVRLSYELNNLIIRVQPENEKLPVVFAGRYHIAPRFHTNFMQGQLTGHSLYEWGDTQEEIVIRGISLMRTLGINFDMPNDDQIKRAVKEAASMPPYPFPGCVKRMQDYIVVRLSEDIWEDEYFLINRGSP